MRRARREILTVVIGILLPLVPGSARALPFTASVERFEADGNAYGSPGGALDLVDEFDDGVLGPNFAILLGTATESGGSLTLHDPGVSVPLTGLPQEISTVESTVDVANDESPFPSVQAFVLSPEGEVLLGAAAIPTATPPPQCTAVIDPVRVKFQHYSFPPGEQAFRMKGTLLVGPNVPPVFNPVTQGVLLYATTQYGHLAMYQIPPGALGTAGCGLEDGWKLNGHTFTYVNRSGLLPPACNVSSASGRMKVKLRDDRAKRGHLRFGIVAKEATFSNSSATTAFAGIGLSDDGMGNPVCGNRLITCVPNGATANCR